MRVTDSHRRDFSAYLRWRRMHRGFLPWASKTITKGCADTIASFVELESSGVMPAPKHPRVLAAVLEGKRLLNFQIKQWAESWRESAGWMPIGMGIVARERAELMESYPWLPDWVWAAVAKQAFR